jgi:hypothetical protein
MAPGPEAGEKIPRKALRRGGFLPHSTPTLMAEQVIDLPPQDVLVGLLSGGIATNFPPQENVS